MDVDIDGDSDSTDEVVEKINWAPIINAIIPESYECPQQAVEQLTDEREQFVESVRQLIDETRIAVLCCESVLHVRSSPVSASAFDFRALPISSVGVCPFITLFFDCPLSLLAKPM